ncbi:MAG: DUF177 domain-containing protein [Myxococcales bacterium]|nr:MAG: DUF177 domain-containing protein [Myxococcales bacterium]
MKIRLVEIPEGGLQIDEQFGPDWLRSMVEPREGDLYHQAGPAHVRLHLQRRYKQVLVSGALSVPMGFACSRCDKPGVVEASVKVKETFLPAEKFESEGKKAYDLAEDDFQMALYANDELDLGRYLADSILLELPMYPHCADDAACVGEAIRYEEDWQEDPVKGPVNPAWREGLKRIKLKNKNKKRK